MVNKIRRKVLKSTIIATVGAVVLPVVTGFTKNNGKRSNQNYDLLVIRVFEEWMQQEQVMPLVYIHKCGLSETSVKNEINKQSIKEFKSGNTFLVNGLLLSKIEAAYLASAGSFRLI